MGQRGGEEETCRQCDTTVMEKVEIAELLNWTNFLQWATIEVKIVC